MGPPEIVSYRPRRSSSPIAHMSLSSSGALIMSLTYGFDVKSHDDPFLAAAERALAILEEATVPGAFLVNTFPIRKRLSKNVVSPAERGLQ